MASRRKYLEYWTEIKRVVGGAVVQTTCACAAAGATRKQCSLVAGNQTPCRCACHPVRLSAAKRGGKPT